MYCALEMRLCIGIAIHCIINVNGIYLFQLMESGVIFEAVPMWVNRG